LIQGTHSYDEEMTTSQKGGKRGTRRNRELPSGDASLMGTLPGDESKKNNLLHEGGRREENTQRTPSNGAGNWGMDYTNLGEHISGILGGVQKRRTQ